MPGVVAGSPAAGKPPNENCFSALRPEILTPISWPVHWIGEKALRFRMRVALVLLVVACIAASLVAFPLRLLRPFH